MQKLTVKVKSGLLLIVNKKDEDLFVCQHSSKPLLCAFFLPANKGYSSFGK